MVADSLEGAVDCECLLIMEVDAFIRLGDDDDDVLDLHSCTTAAFSISSKVLTFVVPGDDTKMLFLILPVVVLSSALQSPEKPATQGDIIVSHEKKPSSSRFMFCGCGRRLCGDGS